MYFWKVLEDVQAPLFDRYIQVNGLRLYMMLKRKQIGTTSLLVARKMRWLPEVLAIVSSNLYLFSNNYRA